MFRFQDPWILLILLFLPALVWYYFSYSPGGRIRFSTITNIRKIRSSKSILYRKSLIILRTLGIALIVLAMALVPLIGLVFANDGNAGGQANLATSSTVSRLSAGGTGTSVESQIVISGGGHSTYPGHQVSSTVGQVAIDLPKALGRLSCVWNISGQERRGLLLGRDFRGLSPFRQAEYRTTLRIWPWALLCVV